MNIGIVGTGEMGSALARKFAGAGHAVRIANSRGHDGARAAAEASGAEADDVEGVMGMAEVLILAMPFPSAAQLPKALLQRLDAGTIVVDVANYFPDIRDPHIADVDAGMPESVWISHKIGRPVVKAFNSVLFHTLDRLGTAEGTPGRLAIPVAADDDHARQIVMGLVEDAGFDPVDAGPLEESWRQEPLTPVYCCDYGAALTRRALAAAVRGKAAGIRDRQWWPAHLRLFADNPSYERVHGAQIALNRSLNPVDSW